MERKGILIRDNDMAVTLSEPAAAGDMVVYEKAGQKYCLPVKESIPCYRKAACRDIRNGELVYKYGQVIGRAVEDIPAGYLIHTHNLKSVCLAPMPEKDGD